MDDLIADFLVETNESLEALDQDLLNLEQNPNDKDLLGNIFRLMHTIKGTCGFLGLPRLEKVAHHAENVLGRFRDGDLDVIPEYVTLIFESIDQIKFIVGGIGETGAEPEGTDTDLIERLDAVYEGREAAQAGAAPEPEPEAAPEEAKAEEEKAPEPAEIFEEKTEAELDALFENKAEIEAKERAEREKAEAAAVETEKEKKPAPPPAAAAAKQQTGAAPVVNQTLRVSVDVLENLMTMVSEMVLTRNQLLQILRNQKESEFSAPLQRLNHVVSDLQEGVMKTRMQPIGNAWSKLPRIVRDLSMEMGKKIDLEMIGQETELDRQVLEMIKDPLTHMVRNSADHGVEMPKDRTAAGKPETGKITLSAFHEGGHIIIEIKDDGKGLPMGKIKEKVLANGLATEEELAAMSTQQIQQFIFHAGLSTAEKVTSVSGRGVGMDVVRTNIEKIGGSVELRSTEGEGSTFSIKIPLTLAIVSALIVESGKERFAIPQISVRELVMISDKSEIQIETIKGTPFFRLREQLLPLVSLKELLKLETKNPEKSELEEESVEKQEKTKGNRDYIVVTQIGGYSFGIVVDKVFDTEEIVVKPVAKIIKNIDVFSGNTILGDGSVIMIIDPAGIARATGDANTTDAAVEEPDASTYKGEKTSLLLFRAGTGSPKAIPLSLISRLEEIDLSKIETSGGQKMIQYREKLMPLMTIDPETLLSGEGHKPTIVFADETSTLGLVVDEIVDIVETHIDIQVSGGEDKIFGSAIIEDRATDIVNVGHFLQKSNKNWFKRHSDKPFGEKSSGTQKLLLVDDSPFFRNMLSPLLTMSGYEVTTKDSPVKALQLCEAGEKFDVIVSDIEMPEMNGFEFAKRVRADKSNWKSTPMVALTSHATPQDMDRGREVGFSKYVAKFDRETLLDTLSQTLNENSGDAA